ncbi:MAG: hypothetical protein WCB36_06835 [Burkholderiales bacterium]
MVFFPADVIRKIVNKNSALTDENKILIDLLRDALQVIEYDICEAYHAEMALMVLAEKIKIAIAAHDKGGK